MPIKGFKDIIDKRGYKVNKKDRDIFQRAIAKASFGVRLDDVYRHGKTDVIEFVLYDSNDNQLPQGDGGDLVRYIYLDSANIGEYFTIDNTNRKSNDAPQFIINSERLIRDAGYSNGIFKTQITLLNRRLGADGNPFDKVWIHEISPSRTEIRVLPTVGDNEQVIPDLQERYDLFINDGEFRDDTILGLFEFVQSISTQKVFQNMLTLKGSVASGETYINLIKQEFKIYDFENMLNRVKSRFATDMTYYAQHRDYDFRSLTYTQPLSGNPPVRLATADVVALSAELLFRIIEDELPKRQLQNAPELSLEQQVTFDELQQILETVTSDSIYKSTEPSAIDAIVRGCTDPNALNYNPLALEDDDSCRYLVKNEEVEVGGCTDPNAINYNPLANSDDGTCIYQKSEANTITETYYSWCMGGTITYTDVNGVRQTTNPLNINQAITIRYIATTKPLFSCRFETRPQVQEVPVIRCGDTTALNYGAEAPCIYGYLDPQIGDVVTEGITVYPDRNTYDTTTPVRISSDSVRSSNSTGLTRSSETINLSSNSTRS